ncbi:MAG TPA: EAL domain-containing protein, partial [Rhizomicrobium sp.]|nr:EAL domain-containing protein [Rhizomicrobium sp.]
AVVFAWTEPALAAQYRRLSIFVAAVVSLIAAATLITGGLAVMTGHAAPRWAAATLLALLAARLSETGMFDTSLATAVGGPYGLTAFFAGLALAAGIRLVDIVAPFEAAWAPMHRYTRLMLYGVLGLALLAFLGVPVATVAMEAVVLFGTSGLAAYLVHRGRAGVLPARVIAPSATIFSLVALAAAVTTVGGFADNFAAPAVVGGFAAAGALLLALAIVAGEGLVTVPHWRLALANLQHHMPGHRPFAPHTDAALAAIGASHQGVFDLDLQKQTVGLSPEAANLIGFKNKQRNIKHSDWIARIHPDDRDTYTSAIEQFSAHTGLAFRIEFRVKSGAGRYPWFELRATMLGDEPPAIRCLGLMADITSRKDNEPAPAPTPANRDPLTGLGNRAALEEQLAALGERLGTIVLAMLDVDRFKAIHASLGDAGADTILKKIGERIDARFAGRARTYRLGGDSFVLLMADNGEDPTTLGAQLVETCAAAHDVDGRNVFAPASVGLAIGRDAAAPQELLKNAERALVQAKREGGATARIFSKDMETAGGASPDSVQLEAELRRALDEDELDVFYQPIVRLADRSVVGFEALLRWHHPARGLVVPSDFIAHSEETGLIVPLGRFALEKAAKEIAGWQRFFPLSPPLFVNVNLSKRQLLDPAFESVLRTVLARDKIARGTLKLEVTETAVATAEGTRGILERLRAVGAGLALDDFGTGMSNFAQLKDLPFDTLKIDRSFLARHSGREDSEEATVLRSILSLARDLKRAVIVEGVETEHDAAWVKSLGCEYAQGFCFSQPLPASEALNYLAMHFDEKTAIPASGAAGL